MIIPKQLQNPEFRFVLLGEWDSWKNKTTNEVTKMPPEVYEEMKKETNWMPLGKAPFEKDWQDKGYVFNDARLVNHIKTKNFGVIGGYGNLRILDIDDKELAKTFEKKLNTFTVKTGGGGRHFYFISDYDKNHVLVNELGELRANNYQVVSAPCKHPSGSEYKVIRDVKIKKVSSEVLKTLIQPYLRTDKEFQFVERPKDTSGSGLEYRRVLALIREGKTKEEIFNEMMKYSKWAVHGGKFPQYRETTYNNALKFHKANPVKENEHKNKIEVLWDKDLQSYEEEVKDWIIDKLIPSRSVCVLTGKRGTMKTFIALLMSYSIASGREFLEHFHTQKGGVIYLDKENGIPIMKERTKMIKKGLGLEDSLQVGFICFSQLKIDKNTDVWKIEELIEEHQPKLLIIDTYRRGISFDENDAGAVSHLFVDILRPLVEKHNISILLIHHNRKGTGEVPDEMDEIRGSSDLANYADIILKMERPRGTELILKQLKNRNAPEEQPIVIDSYFEDDSIRLNYKGEYIKRNQAEKCAEILTIWFAEKNITNFSTKDAREIAFKQGIRETNLKNALIILQDNGIISKIIKGKYKVRAISQKLHSIGM